MSIALALLVAAIDSWGRVLGVAIFYCDLPAGREFVSHAAHHEEQRGAAGIGDSRRVAAGLRWRAWWGTGFGADGGAGGGAGGRIPGEQRLCARDAIIAANVDRSVAYFTDWIDASTADFITPQLERKRTRLPVRSLSGTGADARETAARF